MSRRKKLTPEERKKRDNRRYYEKHYIERRDDQRRRYTNSNKCGKCRWLQGPHTRTKTSYYSVNKYFCCNDKFTGVRQRTKSLAGCIYWEGYEDDGSNQDQN